MTSLALRLLVAALVATTGAAPMQAAPLPVPKPDGASVAVVAPADVPAPMRFDDTTVAAVRSAVSSLDLNDLSGALAAVKGRSQLEQDIVTWLAIRRQVSGLTPDAVTEFSTRNPHWPSTAIFRRRAEQALSRANLPAKTVVEAFASAAPISEEGTLALARALVADKRAKDAAKVLGPWWAEERLSPERDQQILREFGEILTRDDHKARFDTQMYAD
ncbi:MAG TPA: hypothetical protein VMP03_05665, partial [Methylomirabilota bacterium]|nr:hypothetical protein [Methylomirabilota bacterium]